MSKNTLPIPLSESETTWGLRYLFFHLAFLASILNQLLQPLIPDYSSIHLNLAYFSVNFLAAAVIFRNFLRESLVYFCRNLPKVLLWAALGCAAYQLLSLVTAILTAYLMPNFFNVNDAHIAADAQEAFLPMSVGIVVLAPFAEEIFHRALIFGGLHRRNRWLAYAVSIVVFATIHVSGYIGYYDWALLGVCFLQYIPAGLVLALSYEQSGSIFCPIAIHIAVNLVGTLSMR